MMVNSSRKSIAKLAVLAAFTAVFGVASLTTASAQNALPTKPIELTLNGAPVKQALNILFQSAGLNYTLDPSVTGYIGSISLHGVSFETALKAVLRSANPPLVANRDEDTGVYYVSPKVDASAAGSGANQTGGAGVGSPGGGAPGGISPTPAPAPSGFSPTPSVGTGISLSQFETIQLRYADATILIGLLGQPSLIVPATSMSAESVGGKTGGGARGPSTGGSTSGQSGFSTGGTTTTTAGAGGNTAFGGF